MKREANSFLDMNPKSRKKSAPDAGKAERNGLPQKRRMPDERVARPQRGQARRHRDERELELPERYSSNRRSTETYAAPKKEQPQERREREAPETRQHRRENYARPDRPAGNGTSRRMPPEQKADRRSPKAISGERERGGYARPETSRRLQPEPRADRRRPQAVSGEAGETERDTKRKASREADLRERAREKAAASERPPRQGESDPARQTRPQSQNRRNGGRIVLILLAILILFGGLGFLGYKYIRADEIAVRGNTRKTSEYIIGLSGIKTGTHVFKVDRERAKKGIETDPYLTLKNIEYTFPNKITLVVNERQATACFEFKGVYVVTDSTGFILESVSESEKPALPVIFGINVTEFALGAKIRTDDTYKQSVMSELLKELDKYKLTSVVGEIHLEDVNSLTFSLNNSMGVNMGLAEKVDEKLVWLANILPELENEGKQGGTIDISSVDMPVYIPAESTGQDDTGA